MQYHDPASKPSCLNCVKLADMLRFYQVICLVVSGMIFISLVLSVVSPSTCR